MIGQEVTDHQSVLLSGDIPCHLTSFQNVSGTQCSYIFYSTTFPHTRCPASRRFASLDLGRLATSFCLLRLPKMPEIGSALKDGVLPHFTPSDEVDTTKIAFRDKVREKARQARLLTPAPPTRKEKAAERQAAKERKQAARRQAAMDKGRNPDKKRGKHAQLMDEWDELAKEERLHKKLRRRKITREEFDRQMEET